MCILKFVAHVLNEYPQISKKTPNLKLKNVASKVFKIPVKVSDLHSARYDCSLAAKVYTRAYKLFAHGKTSN